MSRKHNPKFQISDSKLKKGNRKLETRNQKPFIIALTGPACSGKTTAANYLVKQGYCVIDVDKFAHALYVKGTPLYDTLKKKYGSVIITDSGEINRKILGAKVLSTPKTYEEYCGIIYPVMNKALIKAVKTCGSKVVILDMAVVFDSGFYKKADAVIYVLPSETVLKRAMLKRGNVSFLNKIRRFQSLFPSSKKIALSDYVIYNNSNIDKLNKETSRAVSEILEAFDGPTGRKRRTNKENPR